MERRIESFREVLGLMAEGPVSLYHGGVEDVAAVVGPADPERELEEVRAVGEPVDPSSAGGLAQPVNGLGSQVPYNCPNCGGVLWQMDTKGAKRYRCHTGHSYTVPTLLASQSEKIEEMLWISLRMFEERKNLLNSMAKAAGPGVTRAASRQRLKETQGHIERIRSMLLDPESQSAADTLTRVKGLMAEPRKARSAR